MRRMFFRLLPFAVLFLFSVAPGAAVQVPDQYANGIVVSGSASMPPICSLGLNGEAKGLAVDLWRAWSVRTGVPVRFALGTWGESLEMVRSGEADAHSGLYFSRVRTSFLDYGEPYVQLEDKLFARKSLGITSVDELVGRKIGTLRQGYSDYFMKKHYPGMSRVAFDSSEDMVRAAVEGRVDAFLTEYPTLQYQLGAMAAHDDFVAVQVLYEMTLHPAVSKGNGELLDLIDRGFAAIPANDRERIRRRWIPEEPGMPKWLVPSIVIAALVLLGVVLCLLSGGRCISRSL